MVYSNVSSKEYDDELHIKLPIPLTLIVMPKEMN